MIDIHLGDNLPILQSMPAASFDLIYVDPPFNTGKVQVRRSIRTVRDEQGGDRRGFQGKRYRTIELGTKEFKDAFDDFTRFLAPRLAEAHRLLKPQGSLFVHLDYREVHECKVLILDRIFGRESFINEIVWAYDYGGRSRRKWSTKHDTILWYARDPKHYTFNYDEIDRIPYMAPGLVGPEKAARGKTPTKSQETPRSLYGLRRPNFSAARTAPGKASDQVTIVGEFRSDRLAENGRYRRDGTGYTLFLRLRSASTAT